MNQDTHELSPKTALFIGAHADDMDFFAGGTAAQWAKAGCEVYYLVLTDGSKGSNDPNTNVDELIKTRQQEQREAAKILGVKKVFFMTYPDGELENNTRVKHDIVAFIRHLKPDTVVSLDPTVIYVPELGLINHPDHRAAGQAVLDAVYPLARDHLAFPDQIKKGLQPHNVSTILLVNITQHNFGIDITDMFDTKLQALRAHISQNLDTSVATKFATQGGEICGCKYAEIFVRIDIGRF